MNDLISTSIGPLMKAARKFRKFNQSDVASAIGCSQSALSKMEHNLLVPSAPQWFLFSRFTSIPPETIETGIIDRHSRVKLNNDQVSLGFKLPKRYRLNRAQKVREVYPFLFYLEKKIDGDVFEQFSKSVGIDQEFFLDYDNLVNFQLIIDLVNLYLRVNLTEYKDIHSIANFGQNQLYWDHFGVEWKKLKTPKEVLEAFALEQPVFQGDFTLHVDDKNGTLTVAYVAQPHLYHFLKDVTPEVTRWLTNYRKATLENLLEYMLETKIEARPIQGYSKSPLETAFEIH